MSQKFHPALSTLMLASAKLGFLLFGEGNVPWLVHELLLKAEPDDEKRPRVVIG